MCTRARALSGPRFYRGDTLGQVIMLTDEAYSEGTPGFDWLVRESLQNDKNLDFG